MGIRVTSVLVFLLLILASGRSWAFDCKKAYLPVDFVICSAPEVVSANEAHEKAWHEVRSTLDETQKADLLNDQRRWLREYPPQCGIPARGKPPAKITDDMQLCVASALKARATFLRDYGQQFVSAQIAPPFTPSAPVALSPAQPPPQAQTIASQTCLRQLTEQELVRCLPGDGRVPFESDPFVSKDIPQEEEKRIDVYLQIKKRNAVYPDYAMLFFDRRAIPVLLDKMRADAWAFCQKRAVDIGSNVSRLPRSFLAVIGAEGDGYQCRGIITVGSECGSVVAFSTTNDGPWTIMQNTAKEAISQERTQQYAQAAAVAQAQAEAKEEFARKSALHATVFSKVGLNKLTSLDQLQANPFIMKGQTVAILTSFDRMISESEAFFIHYGFVTFPGLYVSGVPATRFRSNEQVILFVRVAGLHEVKGAPTPTLPHGEYLDAYSCQQTDCREMTLQ